MLPARSIWSCRSGRAHDPRRRQAERYQFSIRKLSDAKWNARPAAARMVAMMETATGVKAFRVGKPRPVHDARPRRKELGLARTRPPFIGDKMEAPNILGGGAAWLPYGPGPAAAGTALRHDLQRYAWTSSCRFPAQFSENLEKAAWRHAWRFPTRGCAPAREKRPADGRQGPEPASAFGVRWLEHR